MEGGHGADVERQIDEGGEERAAEGQSEGCAGDDAEGVCSSGDLGEGVVHGCGGVAMADEARADWLSHRRATEGPDGRGCLYKAGSAGAGGGSRRWELREAARSCAKLSRELPNAATAMALCEAGGRGAIGGKKAGR